MSQQSQTVLRCHEFMFKCMCRILLAEFRVTRLHPICLSRHIQVRGDSPDHLDGLGIRLDQLYVEIFPADAFVATDGIEITTSNLLA